MCNLLGNVLVLIFTSSVLLCHGHTFEDYEDYYIENNKNDHDDKYIIEKDNIQAENNLTSKPIKFYLYTRKNPVNYEQMYIDNEAELNRNNLDATRPVKILIHGWNNDFQSQFNVLLKNAYLTEYNTNVIIVDWSKYSKSSYFVARFHVTYVAKVVAAFIDKLSNTYGIRSDNIHIVGHSLGAHIGGISGLNVNIGKIARITGLDPAGPFFALFEENRISPKTAKFVDIIHTAGATVGFYRGLGHVDFYPNGGAPIQPGCGLDVTLVRSHRRSYWLYAESITSPNGFLAVSCTSWTKYKWNYCNNNSEIHMGEHVSTSARGKYYLRTNSKTPFALEST